MNKQKSVYQQCLTLSDLIYTIVYHFPVRMKYSEGVDLRRTTIDLVTDCLFYIRATSKEDIAKYKEKVNYDLTRIEAQISVINNVKVCIKGKGKQQRWDRLISSSVEIRLQTIIANIRECL